MIEGLIPLEDFAFVWFPLLVFGMMKFWKHFYSEWIYRLQVLGDYSKYNGKNQVYKKKAGSIILRLLLLTVFIFGTFWFLHPYYAKISIMGYIIPTWQYILSIIIIRFLLLKFYSLLWFNMIKCKEEQ